MNLPPVRIPHPHVVVEPDSFSGSPMTRTASSTTGRFQVPVRRLWAWHRKGVTVATLVKRYPQLGWAVVLDALSFAYDNEEIVEADLDRERALIAGEPERVPGLMRQLPLPLPP